MHLLHEPNSLEFVQENATEVAEKGQFKAFFESFERKVFYSISFYLITWRRLLLLKNISNIVSYRI